MSFGGDLRTLRQEAVVSRADLARRAGVPVSALRHWENGRGLPGVPAFLRLAEALGVPAERLAEGVDDPADDESEPAQDAHGQGAVTTPGQATNRLLSASTPTTPADSDRTAPE